jgi:hypothetical protein
MERHRCLTVEERARITEIQDSLIDRYVEQKTVIKEGNRCRAMELELEIEELLRGKRKSSIGRLVDRPGLTIAPVRAVGKTAQSESGKAWMRIQTGFGTLIAIIAFVVLAGPGVAPDRGRSTISAPVDRRGCPTPFTGQDDVAARVSKTNRIRR